MISMTDLITLTEIYICLLRPLSITFGRRFSKEQSSSQALEIYGHYAKSDDFWNNNKIMFKNKSYHLIYDVYRVYP